MNFTIAGVELSCAGRLIELETEREIAFRLMLLGGWALEQKLHFDDQGKLERLDYELNPAEPEPTSQEFSLVGTLSSMYSALYNLGTLGEDGQVTTLRREPEPGALAQLIPTDYWDRQDRALPLWQFNVEARSIEQP